MATQTGPKIAVFDGAAAGDTYGPAAMSRAWRMLQALVQPNVIGFTDTPPVSPSDGDTYIVAPGATGAWATHDNAVAFWTLQDLDNPSGIWEFYSPLDGWMLAARGFAKESSGVWRFDGTEWTFGSFIGERGTGLFLGAGAAVTINLATGYPDTNYQVFVSYDNPVASPGFISIEYVSGTQFKIHSSSATDASAFRWFAME